MDDVAETLAAARDAYRRRDWAAAREAACRIHLEEGRPGPAAMAAVGVAVNAFLRGDGVVGAGWLGRGPAAAPGPARGPGPRLPALPGAGGGARRRRHRRRGRAGPGGSASS